MARFTIGSYNRFIGSAMRSKRLSRAESVELYRSIREKTGAPVFQTYLKNHPRISSGFAKKIVEKRSSKGASPIEPRQLPPMQKTEFKKHRAFDDDSAGGGQGGSSSDRTRERENERGEEFDAGAFDDLDALEFEASEDGGDIYE